jgi:hypothetical protein
VVPYPKGVPQRIPQGFCVEGEGLETPHGKELGADFLRERPGGGRHGAGVRDA